MDQRHSEVYTQLPGGLGVLAFQWLDGHEVVFIDRRRFASTSAERAAVRATRRKAKG